MPAGLLVTVPVPKPVRVTFSNICNVPAGSVTVSIHAASLPVNTLGSLAYTHLKVCVPAVTGKDVDVHATSPDTPGSGTWGNCATSSI